LELCKREMAGKFSLKMADFHLAFRDLVTCRKSTTWDPQLYFISEGKRAECFFALKNPTNSVGFEPANLCSKGQHATSGPPKPLAMVVNFNTTITFPPSVHFCHVLNPLNQVVTICTARLNIKNMAFVHRV
jgi:hypothetical protein